MDTDDLPEAAYKGILIEAEKFHHDLTQRFGVLLHVKSGYLLIISSVDSQSWVTKEYALITNRIMMKQADKIVVGYMHP